MALGRIQSFNINVFISLYYFSINIIVYKFVPSQKRRNGGLMQIIHFIFFFKVI